MELFTIAASAVILIVVFDLLAARFGTDSRDGIGDDHRRAVGV